MTYVDHLMIVLLFVGQPVWGRYAWSRLLTRIAAGQPVSKAALYRETLWLEWVALVLLAGVWLVLGRPAADLGLIPPAGAGFVLGALILVAVSTYLAYTWHAARRATHDEIESLRASLGELEIYAPDTPETYRRFVTVSITAGICEEIIYRGYAFWYLGQYMPTWAVLAVSSIAFGLGHSYQGLAGMVRTGVIGLAFGLFYLLTGSIWLPILGHIVLDILQGGMIYECLRRRQSPDPLRPDYPMG